MGNLSYLTSEKPPKEAKNKPFGLWAFLCGDLTEVFGRLIIEPLWIVVLLVCGMRQGAVVSSSEE